MHYKGRNRGFCGYVFRWRGLREAAIVLELELHSTVAIVQAQAVAADNENKRFWCRFARARGHVHSRWLNASAVT
jgi:hypothetical protein